MITQDLDLFGNPVEKNILLRDKYGEPPFSVINTQTGSWHARKKLWKGLGIKSEVGRTENLLGYSGTFITEDMRAKGHNGTSVFDPVLCELMYRWFCPENGFILDPFAGGSVRGVVANYLGYKYTGIELREEQVHSNRIQAKEILLEDNQPVWHCGDSAEVLKSDWDKKFDLLFTCPPYMNLEVYSDHPADLSNMSDNNFTIFYEKIIKLATTKIKNDGFCILVIGDVRDKKTGFYKDFISITKNAFYKSGWALYNDCILLEALGMAAVKADRTFSSKKKLVKVHQNILIFSKK